ncbi:TetR/AcrR family transcriptional regulator [Pseudoduganella sp. RAF53_2]|uniref:TetR/AcrR family transcriptional regulator n=1 Tax=unclassified Pseudoduganella TaxID=2637179 RepID=UPI003F965054
MTTLPPTDANRRGELLRVAARLFREKGFDGTTTRDIADAAGMRSGSPFYHFKSKQDLLAAVMEEGLLASLPAAEKIASGSLPPREKFEAMARAHLEMVLGKGHDFIPVLLYEWRCLSPEHKEQVRAQKERYDALWQIVITELEAAGLLQTDAKSARLLLLGALNYSVQWYQPSQDGSIRQLAHKVGKLFLPPEP